jgi:hypothetical protein
MYYNDTQTTALEAFCSIYTWAEGLRWTIAMQRSYVHRWSRGQIFNPLPWPETKARIRMTNSAFIYLANRYRLDRMKELIELNG